ncbi:MAG: carbon-nitrogen hydrolase family protein [Sulfitobacter sp.]
MISQTPFKVAAIQSAPVFMDVQKSLEKACGLISEAGKTGAVVAGFSETWLPGHCFFAMEGLSPLWWEAAARYLEQSIVIPGPETDRLCDAAKAANIDVVIGVVEREPRTHGSVYCTILMISNQGEILGRHRKTRPTMQERVVWSDGDASGLVVYERPYGRLSALCCWEHNTVLPGYALMQQGTQVHFSLWPGMEVAQAPAAPASLSSRQLLLSRAFASQAAAYVVCVGGLRSAAAVPEEFQSLLSFEHTGDSYIIDARGEVIAGPATGEEILVHEVDPKTIRGAKVASDVGGHYNRSDLFEFSVNRAPMPDFSREDETEMQRAPEL